MLVRTTSDAPIPSPGGPNASCEREDRRDRDREREQRADRGHGPEVADRTDGGVDAQRRGGSGEGREHRQFERQQPDGAASAA